MTNDPPATVDVTDMLCVQALAVVAEAMRARAANERLKVIFNSESVRQDLLVWARTLGHRIEERGGSLLILTKRKT